MNRFFSRSQFKNLFLQLAAVALICVPAAVLAQSPWQIEVVDGSKGSNVGKFTSLAIDKDNNLHIGYYDETRQALRYGFRGATGKWYTMEVDASGGYESLALDAGGHPHFAYAAPNEAGLRYAWWDGAKWNKQTLDYERIDFFNSIRIGPDNLPRISYYHRLRRDGSFALHLKYAHFDGKTWYTETVDPRSATGKFNSLALDSKGQPYIAYSDVDLGDLRFTRWDGNDWNFSTPDSQSQSEGWVGIGSSIELDAAGTPHIAYIAVTHPHLKYATWTTHGWKTETVDRINGKADNIDRVSLKFDSQQRPHLAYWDSGLGVLRHATLTPKGWIAETVDTGDNVGLYPSMVIGANDEIYISYYDLANGVLRLAHRRATETPGPDNTVKAESTKPAPTPR
jgi:hypothetical protein